MASSSPRFSLDPSQSPASPPSTNRSGYPFPPQDALSRSTSSTRYRPRRGSAASSISITSVNSIGGTLDSQGKYGSAVRETSQNAISTLLQPPIVRTGLLPHTQAQAAATGFKAPTTRDIPPVTLTNIPHVPPENFRDYLNRIGPLFENLQRGRGEPDQPAWLKKDKELEKADRFAEALEKKLSRDGSAPPTISRQSSTTSLSVLESPVPSRRRLSGQFRRNRNEPTPLSTIPAVYLEEDFRLENPRTFDVVSERAEIVRPPPGTPSNERVSSGAMIPRKALATNAILQEKLSWYMDTVEVHLINSISAASSGFFAALGSLKELQTEAEESITKIQRLREDLRRLDNDVALSGLEVAAKRRRRENVRRLKTATGQVQMVVESVKRADELVDEGSYDEAADQMDKVGRLVCGQQEPGQTEQELIDLRPLRALQGLDSGLQELQLRIGTGFAQKFTSILLEDLRQHLQKVPSSDTLKRWSRQRGIPPTYMETSDRFRNDLLTALTGLARAGHTAPATAAYREAINKEMKNLIRKHLPSSSDDDTDSMVSTSTRGGSKQLNQQEKSSILARNLRALEPEDAEKLLINIYTSVGEALRRVSTQTKVLLDVTSKMQPQEPRTPPRKPNLSSINEHVVNGSASSAAKTTVQEELSQTLDMSSLLGVAVDTAQTQITRVLKVRNEQSTHLPRERFLRYFTLNRLFADECEGISGRGGNVLRGIINAQISGFVQSLGTLETERIAKALDEDHWNAADFTETHNACLQRILNSMTSDPPEWSKTTAPLWEEPGSYAQANGTAKAANSLETNGTASTAKKETRPAYIDDTRYILVPSALTLLSTIDSFLSLTATLPSLTPQISTALLEVLRTFNSRSCQLILGAGAVRSVGLKNITSKHLALASQALTFLSALVPYLRECVRRHLPPAAAPPPHLLADFDKTKRLLHDHQVEILDKLVYIISARSQARVKALAALDFDAPAPAALAAAEEDPSAYMETLTKETLTLHRVLGRHLAPGDVDYVMGEIFKAYREQWTKAFAAVEVGTQAGERRLLRDVEAMEARLGKIEGFEAIGREIGGVVRAKISVGRDDDDDDDDGKRGGEKDENKRIAMQEKPEENGKVEDNAKK